MALAPSIIHSGKKNRVSLSLFMMVAKKTTSKKRVIRGTIIRKIKNALNLIITRGAYVKEQDGELTLVLDEERAKKKAEGYALQGTE